MLDLLWSDLPGWRCIAAMRGKNTSHYWFDTTDAAMAKAIELDREGFNVYFAPSIFDPARVAARRAENNPRTGHPYSGREQACAHAMPALWIDLDCGEGKDYPDQMGAAQALQAWLEKTGVPAPSFVVSSGYGLHVYWRLTRPASHDQWLPVAKHLKQACKVHGLHADPARTSDSASLMRPPGTHNQKRGEAAPVKVLIERGDTVDLNAFRATLPMVGPVGAVSSPSPGGEWDTSVKLPPGDANKIADKCQQLGQMRFHKGKMSEPVWRAGLSILWRCEGADQLIHTWSEGDPRYDAEQTEDKAAATQGPATCAHFAEVNAEGCAGCPHAGKVTSPINLAYAEDLPDPATFEEGKGGPVKVPGFTVTKEGIYKEPAAEGGPLTMVSEIQLWIEDAREFAAVDDNNMRASLTLAWRDARGREYRDTITQADLHDKRSWVTWLANNNLISFVREDLMGQYISKMHKARYREKGARTIYDRLGWYQDHSLFVIGTQGVCEAGVEDVIVEAGGGLSDLSPKGSLDAWKAGVAPLANPRYQPQAFGLLVGFAAPLLDLVGKEGAVVAFVGQSGKGKTLAAECGLSIFGEPRKLRGNGRDTPNAIGMYLGQLRHVPALLDEVTTVKDHRMGELIYMAANGADKSVLTQKRERKSAMSWRTVTMMTSNHSIVNRPQSLIEEAHRRRLVEVSVLDGVSSEDGATVGQAIQANYGLAAAPYMQLVMQHKDKIPALFTLMEKQVNQWGSGDPADRFGTWTCAAALLGGILAYVAGVLPFNPVPVVKAICQASADNNRDIASPDEMAHETLFELLTTHSKRLCVWTSGKLAVDDTDDPVARIDGGMLYVRANELRAAWDEQHIFHRAIAEWMEEMAPGGSRNMRLAPGTPAVRAYKFDMDKLGWDLQSLKEGSK